MEDMAYFDEKAGHCMKTVDSDKDAADFINLFFAKFLNKNDEISELQKFFGYIIYVRQTSLHS